LFRRPPPQQFPEFIGLYDEKEYKGKYRILSIAFNNPGILIPFITPQNLISRSKTRVPREDYI